MKKQLLFLATAVTMVAGSVYAQDETFRTLMWGSGIYQNETNSRPIYGITNVYGHDLVEAALGLPLTVTTPTNPVLALVIDCSSTTASLVAYDKVLSNAVAVIATSTSLDVVLQHDKNNTNEFANREHFVAQFAVTPTNNLVGGFLTVAGRLQLNPTNGCPRAIKVEIDPLDHLSFDKDVRNLDDPENDDILRAGVAHAVGVVELGNFPDSGSTNNVLLPFENVSIRHQLQ